MPCRLPRPSWPAGRSTSTGVNSRDQVPTSSVTRAPGPTGTFQAAPNALVKHSSPAGYVERTSAHRSTTSCARDVRTCSSTSTPASASRSSAVSAASSPSSATATEPGTSRSSAPSTLSGPCTSSSANWACRVPAAVNSSGTLSVGASNGVRAGGANPRRCSGSPQCRRTRPASVSATTYTDRAVGSSRSVTCSTPPEDRRRTASGRRRTRSPWERRRRASRPR